MKDSRAVLVLVVALLVAQGTGCQGSRTVTGRVTNHSGEPIVRAVVSVPGTLNQTVTNESGAFTLSAPRESLSLLIRGLGYDERTVSLPLSQSRVDARLELNEKAKAFAVSLQLVDSSVVVEVANPAYREGSGPVVLIDEGHHNFHTATGRYLIFANLLKKDGYDVRQSPSAFTREALSDANVLVIANAFHGLENGSLPALSAFHEQEIATVVEWVRQGCSLFLIADHMPAAGAAADLTAAFGVGSMNGFVYTIDRLQGRPSPMIFRRSDRSLRAHSIIEGRSAAERVDSVATFTGQALDLPDTFAPLLVFRDDAESWNPETWYEYDENTPKIKVEGQSQGAVANIGEGRVAIFGEAAMFTSQVRGTERRPDGFGLGVASQNQQLLLNVMHWLTGLLGRGR